MFDSSAALPACTTELLAAQPGDCACLHSICSSNRTGTLWRGLEIKLSCVGPGKQSGALVLMDLYAADCLPQQFWSLSLARSCPAGSLAACSAASQ